MKLSNLTTKSCIPCKGETAALDPDKVNSLLYELNNNWLINDIGHLYKAYKFKNFVAAMTFANKITVVAEKENHHPDLTISWGQCGVEIWTHKINNLSENDFILAAKIEELID